jgi:hypothetical protein
MSRDPLARGALALALAGALLACGTTSRFVEQPPLTIDDPAMGGRQAAANLFGLAPPYTVRLCDADALTRQCLEGHEGIRATGVGGLVVPLTLRITAMTVSKQSQVIDGWAVDASFQSRVDAISPMCQAAQGRILSRDDKTLALHFDAFYCNWLVIGNVLVFADLSIDDIRLKERAFSGFYKVRFHGIGNASGSGYYRASIDAG